MAGENKQWMFYMHHQKDFISSVNHKRRYFEEMTCRSFQLNNNKGFRALKRMQKYYKVS